MKNCPMFCIKDGYDCEYLYTVQSESGAWGSRCSYLDDRLITSESLEEIKEDERLQKESKKQKSITKIIEETAEEICNNYCKWPEKWDEEKEGFELCESEICLNCPLNNLV